VAQSDRARGGRHAQGTTTAGAGAARDADEPAGTAQHGPRRRGWRHDPAGDAGVLPAAENHRRPGRFHRWQDPQRARLRADAVSAMEGLDSRVSAPVTINKKPERIAGMFDAIAPNYDRLNHVLSGGVDWWWRRRAVRALELTGRERVLDLCTGTADLAMPTVRARHGAREVVGIDFAGAMLAIGAAKVRRAGLSDRVRFARGDAEHVP